MSVLIFLAVLVVLVLVHEFGHFAVAKWTGMRVDEFGVGFPPRLFGVRRGETEYTVNALPLGGFVRILGEDGIVDPSARLAENLSEASVEGKSPASGQFRYGKDGIVDPSVRENDGGRTFTAKSRWAQSAVLIAGVTMNILFAWFLVTVAFTIGVDSAVSESEAGESARLTVTNVLSGSPAERAGLSSGSVLVSVNTEETALTPLTPSSFRSFIGAHADEAITVLYTAGDELRVAQLTPETGIVPDDAATPAVGVALTLVDRVERGILESGYDALLYTLTSLRDITLGIAGLVADAVRFNADLSQVAGPVGIVGLVGEASAYGITALLMFTAFISLNLAVINILPFPALDGGRLLFVVIEAVKGSPIRAEYTAGLNTVGFFLLIFLMVAVTWNDIIRLI